MKEAKEQNTLSFLDHVYKQRPWTRQTGRRKLWCLSFSDFVKLLCLHNWICFSYRFLHSDMVIEGAVMYVCIAVCPAEEVTTATFESSQTNPFLASSTSGWSFLRFWHLEHMFIVEALPKKPQFFEVIFLSLRSSSRSVYSLTSNPQEGFLVRESIHYVSRLISI